MKSITTFLMFVGDQAGKAEEAITLYTSLFDNSEILRVERYGAEENEPEGSVRVARFTLNGVEHMAIDSALNHEFTFTPSVSLYVECDSSEEIGAAYKTLLEDGKALMPLDNYGFSQMFGWISDKYGVSWQFNLGNSS